MSEMTRLDQAFLDMEAAPDDDAARLRFYEVLASVELFLMLEEEAEGDQIKPQIMELYGQNFVLAFDLEHRLTEITGGPAPYAAVSGRTLAAMLASESIGIALNVDVAPSSFFVPAEAVQWLAETLSAGPEELEKQPEAFYAPKGLPEALLSALDMRLASATGLAHSAYLVAVRYTDGSRGHLLGVVDAVPGSEGALAQAVSEVLAFSGLDAATLDVAFFQASDLVTAKLAKDGLRFDLPQPEEFEARAPGMDPDKPPRLH